MGQFFDRYYPVDLTRRPTAPPTGSARRPATTLFSGQQLLTRKPAEGGGDVAPPTFEPKSPPAPNTPQPTTCHVSPVLDRVYHQFHRPNLQASQAANRLLGRVYHQFHQVSQAANCQKPAELTAFRIRCSVKSTK